MSETAVTMQPMRYLDKAMGALRGYENPTDMDAKKAHYAFIQALGARFTADFDTLICRELLANNHITPTPAPAERTAAYYAERPCAAYVAALRICPFLADYAVLSHASAEQGHSRALARLEQAIPAQRPLLHLDMRLGEGTGGAVAYGLLRCAADIYNDMATFGTAGVAEQTC